MIKIIALGKIKEKETAVLIQDYIKRIMCFCRIKVIELKDEKIRGTNINKIKDLEAEKILDKLSSLDYIIVCDEQGKSLSSIGFSDLIKNKLIENKNIVFVIGGALGLSDRILKRANLRMSFSSMTFPHRLFRLILVEQIYRAFSIINNKDYHK